MLSHREAVEALIAAREQKDKEAVAALLADHVELSQPQSLKEEPTRGRDAVATALSGGIGGAFFDLNTMVRRIKRISVADDVVFVEQHVDAKTPQGTDYSNDYVWVYTFEGELIAHIEEHLDTLRFSRIIKAARAVADAAKADAGGGK